MSAVYDQKKIDALASELMEPQRLAEGGPPRSRIAKAAAAVRRSIGDEPLEGAPTRANVPNIGEVMLGRNREAEEAARRAAEISGVPYQPTTRFAPVDVDRATRIAREYDLMKHAPDDPMVKRAYEQMIKETNDQYEAMLQAGIEPYFIEPGNDPYRNSPYEVLLDVAENRRLGVFPSVEGFGTDPNFNPAGNPMLQETGRMISGRPALANDLFRAVHDYFGHAKPGVGFRAAGEENAYQSHAGMFSPLARRALASETRGQNSWLNYGPYGETNRTARIEDTRFADQKAGLMPRWASEAGLVINDDRRREFFDNLARNRTGLEGAISDDGKLRLVHYSSRPLERIDPEFYGRGLSRASLAERNRSYDPEFVKRSYYGIPASENPYVPEFGLGGIRNEVLIEPELIYQAQANPEGLWLPNDPTGSERRIAESGYTGYYTNHPKLGKVAVIFDPYDVTKTYMVPVGAVGAGAMVLSGEEEPETMAKGGLVDKLRSAASSVKEAGNVYKAAVGNMFSPFEPTEPQLGDPNDYEFPELRLRRPGIVNLAIGMPNMFADMRYLFGNVKDAASGDEVPDEQWPRWDKATEAQGRYEEDMDTWLRAYTGKSVDELSAPMSAVLGVSEALVQPGIISARAVEKLPRLARYLSHLAEFATPVTVASPGAMMTSAGFNAGIRVLPALTDSDDLEQMNARYSGRELSGAEQARLDNYLQELLGKKDGGLIDRINQGFYENISKPAVGTAIDMTLGLGDLAQMAARYLGNKAGFDAGEFTSVAQPVKEAIGVDDYNPYTIGGVGASILPFAAAGRTAQAINAAPAGVRQIQAALPNLGRESAAYVGAEAAGAGAREFMPDSPMAEVLASVAGGMGGSALGSQPTSMGIIKEKGGNWLDQSIKNRVQDLHTENQYGGVGAPADRLAAMEARYTPEVMASFDPDLREQAQGVIDTLRSHAQIDNWIDSKLTKYIRNEMATESDPIRLQADAFEGIRAERLAQKDEQIARAIDNMERARLERGRTPEEMTRSQAQIRELQRERALIAAQTGLHVNPETIGFDRYKAPQARERLGYPEYGSGRSYAGKAWEDSSDVAINRTTPEAMLSGDVKVISGNYVTRNNFLQKYPWMQSIPSDASIYGLDVRRGGMDALGFDHMMDELRNATRPDSDLPENLRIDPNNLSKMSVPQIVQKVDEINAYRATLAREANERLANNAATRLYREYSAVPGSETPNQQELRWVELALPDAVLPEGYTTVNSPDGLVRLIDRDGRELSVGATPEEAISLYNRDERTKSLADALKYEGDTLNHCVGGYCDKVVSGRSRIYSLRDALGQPYATIETGKKPILYSDIVQAVGIDAADEMLEKGMSLKQMAESIPEVQNLENILQIKGKRNAAPTEEYLPFVQDFVRSRDWNEVKDLENAGLYKADPYELGMYLPQDERLRNIAGRRTDDLIKAQQAGLFGNQKYLTRREWEDILRRQIESESGPLPDVEGFAKGGLVYDADAINALANELMEPVRLSEGGPPPRSRIAKAAAAVRGATTPPREVPDYLSPQEREFLNRDVITGQQVSERVPTGKNYAGDPYDPSLKIGVDVIRQMPEQMRKQADVMANYLNYPENAPRDPESVFRLLGDQGVENLLWLHDQMPEDVRRMSSYWYEGANKMAGEAAQRYGIPIEGTAGVYAALSPQMDWFKNVSLGNRLMDIMSTQQDQMFTPEMRRRGQELVDLPNAGFNPATAVVLDRIKDARLGDLKTPMEKAIWLRVFDEAHNPREYDIVDPMGNVMGLSLTNKGVPARVSWGGLKPIEKGISMFEDPSISNVTRKLGEMHKVRSFYNNIVDPYSGNSVTSDTHNVAAALLRPLSQSNIEVLHNMGSASSTDITGARGTYGFYADAVRRAAQERGLDTPREMQSITWEGVRGLYPPEMKRSALQKQKIDNAFNQYRRGQISGDQLRDMIGQEGGGIRLPAWYAR